MRNLDRFRLPRIDICSTREKNKILIQAAYTNNNSIENAKLVRTLELHLRKAEVFLKRLSKVK